MKKYKLTELCDEEIHIIKCAIEMSTIDWDTRYKEIETALLYKFREYLKQKAELKRKE